MTQSANTTHTSGPWQWGIDPGYGYNVVDVEGFNLMHVQVVNNSTASQNIENNLTLVCSAPDLLYAAQRALQLLQDIRFDGGQIGATLENAIAKATWRAE